MANQFARKLLLAFLVGAGYIVTVVVGTAILVQATGIELVDSLANLASGLGEGSATAIAVSVLSLFITGGFIAVWVKIRPKIAGMIGLTVTSPKFDTSKKIAFVFAIIIVGAITSGIFLAYAEFTANLVPGTNVNSLNAFYMGLVEVNPMLIVSSFIAVAFFGFLVALLGNWINPIQRVLPKQLQK